jgi:AraC family transcriptional regulator
VVADPCTVLVLAAGEDYRVTHPADGGDACTVLAFPPEITQEALGQSRVSHGILRAGTQLAARRLVVALRQDSAGLRTAEVAMQLLKAIAADVTGQALAQRLGPLARRRAEEVRALLACDPGAAWRLDHIARAVHCSPFHLARQFHAVTGETIWRYLLALRLTLALERIAAGETSMARLADDLGFAHHSHLTACFRVRFASTPSKMRTILTAHRRDGPLP